MGLLKARLDFLINTEILVTSHTVGITQRDMLVCQHGVDYTVIICFCQIGTDLDTSG